MKNKMDSGRWNKHEMIESVDYIQLFMNKLIGKVKTHDRQVFYLISKYFTDGVEFAKINLELSQYHFDIGESHMEKIDKENILYKLVFNSYCRSKSFFYYKNRDFTSSFDLIERSLDNNLVLYRFGFDIILFDSLSQYQNYCKLLFMSGNYSEGYRILTKMVEYLLNWGGAPPEGLKLDNLETLNLEGYNGLKSSILEQIIMYSLSNLGSSPLAKPFLIKILEIFNVQPEMEGHEIFLQKWVQLAITKRSDLLAEITSSKYFRRKHKKNLKFIIN